MKNFSRILAALLLLTGLQLNAQTIHWLTFIDTTDERVGKIDTHGRDVLYSRFIGLINAAMQDKGYKTSIHDIYGARLTPQLCKQELVNLKAGPDDVIVFYYIGHGGRSTNDKTQWPQMQMAQDYDEGFIPLEWVHNTLKGKNARLAVTIGMCCNSYTNGLSAKSAPVFSPNYGNTYMSQNEIENLAKMFANYKGDVILSSSTPGQTSGCMVLNDDVIDAFTGCLTLVTDGLMKGEITPDWDEFLSTTKDLVAYVADVQRHEEQTVQYKTNVSPVSSPAKASAESKRQQAQQQSQKPAPEPEKKSSDSSSQRDEIIEYFTTMFNLLLSDDLDDDTRIELAQTFTDNNPELLNVRVITLGQDGNVVVGRQSLEDFIGRLATTRIMQSVSVADITDRGIKVREVFNK